MDYLSVNRESWNRRAEVHFVSQFYDVDGFLSGKSSLTEIELAELPNLSGQRLLHLQCHFGLDTLSLARMGALCTGIDLSLLPSVKHWNLSRKPTLVQNLSAQIFIVLIEELNQGMTLYSLLMG